MNAAAQPAPVRSHRVLLPILLTLATIIGFFACFAVWINRQALNTDNWTETSSRLLANTQVDEALSVYLVNQLFSSEDVPGKLNEALPSQLQGLSGPLSAGLRQIADRAVPALLETSQVQDLWRKSNRAAHAQLMAILNGGGKVVGTEQGTVTLNLHELVSQLGNQLGLGTQVASAQKKLEGGAGTAVRETAKEKLGLNLPANTGRIVIMRANELKTAQDIAKAVKGLAIVLPAVALALFALAIWLATGRRRVMLRTVGWCFFGIGVALLLLRRIAGQQVVNHLVAVPGNRPAGEAVWSIATSLLYSIAIAMVLYGLVLVAAAWLAGGTRPAVFLRHVAAPWLRDHAVGSYVAAGVVLLLVVLWGPTPATREWLPVLGFAALAAFAVTLLRRQTALEFPHATHGEAVALMRSRLPWSRHDASAAPTAQAAHAPARPAAQVPEAGGGAGAQPPAREVSAEPGVPAQPPADEVSTEPRVPG
jgi:hypothetical protein